MCRLSGLNSELASNCHLLNSTLQLAHQHRSNTRPFSTGKSLGSRCESFLGSTPNAAMDASDTQLPRPLRVTSRKENYLRRRFPTSNRDNTSVASFLHPIFFSRHARPLVNRGAATMVARISQTPMFNRKAWLISQRRKSG